MSHIDSPERQHQLPAAVIIPAFEHEQWFQHLCSRMSCWEAFDFHFELLTFQHLPCSQCNIEKLKYISVLSLFYSGHSELWEFTIHNYFCVEKIFNKLQNPNLLSVQECLQCDPVFSCLSLFFALSEVLGCIWSISFLSYCISFQRGITQALLAVSRAACPSSVELGKPSSSLL